MKCNEVFKHKLAVINADVEESIVNYFKLYPYLNEQIFNMYFDILNFGDAFTAKLNGDKIEIREFLVEAGAPLNDVYDMVLVMDTMEMIRFLEMIEDTIEYNTEEQ